MSVNLESLLKQPAACHTAHGEVFTGALEAVDNDFNCVLGQCSVTAKDSAGAVEEHPLTFVRGSDIMFISFTKPTIAA